MKAWIDPANLAHFIDGNPHFVLGIYDTTDYSDSPAYYTNELAAIAQAPINMIINYYITNAPTQAIIAYTTAMKQFGIAFLPDVAAFYTGSCGMADRCCQRVRNQESGHAGFRLRSGIVVRPRRGWLLHQDEPAITRQPETFHQYGLIKASDPSGFTYAVLNTPTGPAILEGHARCSGG